MIFKMSGTDGTPYSFTYLGHTRYLPNESSLSGYGSDDWYYLCAADEQFALAL